MSSAALILLLALGQAPAKESASDPAALVQKLGAAFRRPPGGRRRARAPGPAGAAGAAGGASLATWKSRLEPRACH